MIGAGRRSAFLGLAALAAAAGVAQAASAQIAPTRSGSSTMTYLSSEEGMIGLMEFGRCYARHERPKALRLIATDPSSSAEVQTYMALFRKGNQGCLGDIIQLNADLPFVRGAIAEGLYRSNVALPPELIQSVPAPADVRNLSGAARCYAATHPNEVKALLADTRPGGRKEYDSVSKMLPDFFKCVPGDAKFNFSATVIRFRLAEALLRTAVPEAAK